MSELSQRLQDAFSDRYRIERELGRGGMGTVFLAEDLKHHRRVAIKVFDPELSAAIGSERFLREIEIVAGLSHPHILPLHDSGAADGLLYFVMPYVEGESLRKRLTREKQLPVEEALRLTREVAGALGHAHGRGVVHRDIKPENILLQDQHAVVADFGIARVVAQGAADTQAVTRGAGPMTSAGVTVGTPAYMSPEQASGSRELDGRSDIYSLGCVLYEMLAGEPPFTGSTAEGVVRQHLVLTPRPVSDLRPSTPPAVTRTIARALAKAPADRFQSAVEFGAALLTAPDEPMSAGSPTVFATSGPTRRGKPALQRIAWATVALLTIGGAYWAFATRGPGSKGAPGGAGAMRRPVLVAEFEGAELEPGVAIAARQMVMAAFDQSDRLEAVASDQIKLALELAGKPDTTRLDGTLARELAFRNGIKVTVEGSIRRIGGTLFVVLTARDSDDGRVLYTESGRARGEDALIPTLGRLTTSLRRQLGERADALTVSGPRWIASTPSFEAYKKYSRAFEMQQMEGDDRGSIELLRETLAIDPDFAEAWALKYFGHGHLGEDDSSQAALAEALKHPDRLTEEGRMFLQGLRDRNSGDLVAADAKYRELIRRGYQLSSSLGNHAAILESAGRYREALQEAQRAVRSSPVGPQQWVLSNLTGLLLMFDEVRDARIAAEGLKGSYADGGRLAIAVTTEEWSRADSLASAFESDPTREEPTRRTALFVSAGLAGSRGSLAEARALLTRAGQPLARILLDLTCGASSIDAPGAASADAPTPTSNPLQLGFAAVARGDLAGARRQLAKVAPTRRTEEPGAANDRALLEACIAGREGRWDYAANMLAPLARLGESPGALVSPPFTRWLAAHALEQAGNPDSAAACFARVLEPTGLYWETRVLVKMLSPYAHLGLARLCTQRGRLKEAEAHLKIGRTQLVHADPDLR